MIPSRDLHIGKLIQVSFKLLPFTLFKDTFKNTSVPPSVGYFVTELAEVILFQNSCKKKTEEFLVLKNFIQHEGH